MKILISLIISFSFLLSNNIRYFDDININFISDNNMPNNINLDGNKKLYFQDFKQPLPVEVEDFQLIQRMSKP